MRHHPLAELMKVARAEMMSNPTITWYTFEDGIEHRHPANPFRSTVNAISEIAKAMRSMEEPFTQLRNSIQDALFGGILK